MGTGATLKNLLLTALLATGLLTTACGGVEEDVCGASGESAALPIRMRNVSITTRTIAASPMNAGHENGACST